MIDELIAKFLPRFTELARTRLARALELAEKRDYNAMPAVVRELHSIVGEAGLLGLTGLVVLARGCEDRAQRMATARDDRDATALIDSLHELDRAIELVETSLPQPGQGKGTR